MFFYVIFIVIMLIKIVNLAYCYLAYTFFVGSGFGGLLVAKGIKKPVSFRPAFLKRNNNLNLKL